MFKNDILLNCYILCLEYLEFRIFILNFKNIIFPKTFLKNVLIFFLKTVLKTKLQENLNSRNIFRKIIINNFLKLVNLGTSFFFFLWIWPIVCNSWLPYILSIHIILPKKKTLQFSIAVSGVVCMSWCVKASREAPVAPAIAQKLLLNNTTKPNK